MSVSFITNSPDIGSNVKTPQVWCQVQHPVFQYFVLVGRIYQENPTLHKQVAM
jgi:hypothetical protein